MRARISAEARTRNKGTIVADFPHSYPGISIENPGEMTGKTSQRGLRSASFLCVAVSVPPTCPRGDGGPRLGGSRDGRSDFGAGLTGYDGGID
jgi:hypothetical protein